MIPVLFVGGPLDGESVMRADTDPPPPEQWVAMETEDPWQFTSFTGMRVCMPPPRVYYQRRLFVTADQRKLWVYSAPGVDSFDVARAVDDLMPYRLLDPYFGCTCPQCVTRDPGVDWFACAGTKRDPHDVVKWEGTPDCWVCGQAGERTTRPGITDQEVAPYGWT